MKVFNPRASTVFVLFVFGCGFSAVLCWLFFACCFVAVGFVLVPVRIHTQEKCTSICPETYIDIGQINMGS